MKSNETQLNNMTNTGSLSPKTSNIIINNNQLKNDTYESVCSPEDTAERNKVAQRHAIAVNGNSTAPSPIGNNNNSNGAMPSNCNGCTSSSNSIISGSNTANDSNRVLKRVFSAPLAANDIKGR